MKTVIDVVSIIFVAVFVSLILGLIFTMVFALTEKDIWWKIALISALMSLGFLILFVIILTTGSAAILGSK